MNFVFFYIIAFGISWASWFIMSSIYTGGQPGPFVYAFSTLGGLGPLFSLLILQKMTGGKVNLRQILSQIKIKGARIPWLFLAIFALPLVTLLGNAGYVIFGREDNFRIIKTGPDSLGLLVLPVILVHFTASLVTSPLFEEPGWRGFALGGLQRKFGRTMGSLCVGGLWWLWHQPMNLTFGLQPTIYSTLWMISISFMIDSLYNLSGTNLLTALLAHQSYGTVVTFLYQGVSNWLQLALLAGFVIVLRIVESRQNTSLPAIPDLAST